MTMLWVPSWQHEAVEIKSNNFVYRGFYQVQEFTLRHKCFSGEWSPWLKREQIRSKDAAAVLLVDILKQKLLLIEQFRVGVVNREQESPWLLEVVAGLQEPNETLMQTMQREAYEEAGCQVIDSMVIGEFYNSPGGFAEKTTLFCAKVDSSTVSGGGIQGVCSEHEDIRVHVLDIDATLSAFSKGILLSSSSTVIALQWLMIHLNQHPFLLQSK
ncbi:MAG: NUDIX domain-containing protein [Proteobacteria bacterium]|nr:NUDIX domain-containing protein [Pseudomonadota bacterium]